MGCNSEEMYQILHKEILNLTLKPGEFVSENVFCERFGVSRTPVRGVLQRLAGEGLVQIVPYKGTQVSLLNFDEIQQLIYLRIAVESMVLKDFIPACTPMLLEKIRYVIRKQAVLLQSDSFEQEEFYELDSRLHEIWFNETRNPLLWQTIQKAQIHYTRFRLLDIKQRQNMHDIYHDHERLFTMIENKKADEAEEYIRQHLYGGIKRLSNKIADEYRPYFTDDISAQNLLIL